MDGVGRYSSQTQPQFEGGTDTQSEIMNFMTASMDRKSSKNKKHRENTSRMKTPPRMKSWSPGYESKNNTMIRDGSRENRGGGNGVRGSPRVVRNNIGIKT